MIFQIYGLIVAGLAAAATAALLGLLWRRAYFGALGGPIVAAAAAAPAAAMLQVVGTGLVQFTPGVGTIDWRPAISTIAIGVLCGGLAVMTMTLIRIDFRLSPPTRAVMERARRGIRAASPYVLLGLGVAVLSVIGVFQQAGLRIVALFERLGRKRPEPKAAPSPEAVMDAKPIQRRRRRRPTVDQLVAAPETARTRLETPAAPPQKAPQAPAPAQRYRRRPSPRADDRF